MRNIVQQMKWVTPSLPSFWPAGQVCLCTTHKISCSNWHLPGHGRGHKLKSCTAYSLWETATSLSVNSPLPYGFRLPFRTQKEGSCAKVSTSFTQNRSHHF